MKIALLQFIFLGIQVLFTAGPEGNVFTELESWSVNSIARPKGSGQNESDHECGSSTDLEKLGKDVWCVRPKVWPQVLSQFGLGKIGEVTCELIFRVAPREIGVGLRKAE